MKSSKIISVIGLFAVVAVAFYIVGKATRPAEDWSRQHANRSSDPREFRNRFLGLTVRAPAGEDWQLVWEPDKFRYPAAQLRNANKVLEIVHLAPKEAPDAQSVGMDLFVQPVLGKPASEMVRELEFREHRPGFSVLSDGPATVGGHPGRIRVSGWALGKARSRSANYYVERGGKFFAFIGVAEATAFERYRPVFDEIMATVRLD